MRRAFKEALISAGALAVLLLALIAVDDRVREQISLRVARPSPVELASAGERVRDLTAVIIEVARAQSVEHAPLLIFALSATVLVMFMLRT